MRLSDRTKNCLTLVTWLVASMLAGATPSLYVYYNSIIDRNAVVNAVMYELERSETRLSGFALDPMLAQEISKRVLPVIVKEGGIPIDRGSCVAIGDNRYVTAKHVVIKGLDITFEIVGVGETKTYTVFDDADLAVLIAEDVGFSQVDLGFYKPVLGQKLFLGQCNKVGGEYWPKGHVTVGYVVTESTPRDFPGTVVAKVNVYPGASGGGVFDVFGKLVGIIIGSSGDYALIQLLKQPL